jgi:putative cardiolipin synthase
MTFKTEPRMDIWRKELIWAWNQALWDAPSKVLAKGEPDPQLLLTTQLAPELRGVSKELIMISAYFVPGQPGLVYLTGRADAGVSVSSADQLAGGHRRASGAWRICTVSQGVAWNMA